MLIIGAKGFSKEVLEICHSNNDLENLVFYDDVNPNTANRLYEKFTVLKSIEEAKEYFLTVDNRFTLGIGNPSMRKTISEMFKDIGGVLTSTISPKADIGSYGVRIGKGANILDGAKISNDVIIGEAPIIYYDSIITHDVSIGDFAEISPNVKILGRAVIGDFCQLGAGSIILPDISIGNNVTLGAGTVVTKDLPDYCTAVGIPSRIIKRQ